MHYMKFEAFNWILHSSFLVLDVQMLYLHYALKATEADDQFVICLYVMIVVHIAALTGYSYQLCHEHTKEEDNEDKYNILPTKVTWWQYALMAVAVSGYIYVSAVVYSYDHEQKSILVHWIMVEAVSFPAKLLYIAL